jgi:hypothetical protein
MEIIGLVGPSGTGKSSIALAYTHDYRVPAIIDDGLLIYKKMRIAGYSAKYEKNKITAVKRATFFFEDHREEVKRTLNALVLDKLLIIGTSNRMIHLICDRLELGSVTRFVEITDLRSQHEIDIALFTRKVYGTHVIPLPLNQVQQHFFKRLISKGMRIMSPQKELIGETTLVHPNFSIGSITISKKVYEGVIERILQSFVEVKSYKLMDLALLPLPKVSIGLSLQIPFGAEIPSLIHKIQEQVIRDYKSYLELGLTEVNVRVNHIEISSFTD